MDGDDIDDRLWSGYPDVNFIITGVVVAAGSVTFVGATADVVQRSVLSTWLTTAAAACRSILVRMSWRNHVSVIRFYLCCSGLLGVLT